MARAQDARTTRAGSQKNTSTSGFHASTHEAGAGRHGPWVRHAGVSQGWGIRGRPSTALWRIIGQGTRRLPNSPLFVIYLVPEAPQGRVESEYRLAALHRPQVETRPS
eukprot:3297499-Prymnesium_polylepis.1